MTKMKIKAYIAPRDVQGGGRKQEQTKEMNKITLYTLDRNQKLMMKNKIMKKLSITAPRINTSGPTSLFFLFFYL